MAVQLRLLLLVGSVAVVVAGCWGGQQSSVAFRTRANRLCRRVLPSATGGLPRSRNGFGAAMTQTRGALTQLADLRPPGSEHEIVRVTTSLAVSTFSG